MPYGENKDSGYRLTCLNDNNKVYCKRLCKTCYMKKEFKKRI